MTTNSEARKRHEERQANCVCNPGDHCWSCGQPLGDSDNAVRPDDSEMVEFEGAKRDTVTNRCDCGEDTITGCGNRPDRHCGLNAEPDTVTIEISVEDAWQLDRLFVPSGEMTVPAEARLIAAIRHELAKVGK